jgi:hypothetical protein
LDVKDVREKDVGVIFKDEIGNRLNFLKIVNPNIFLFFSDQNDDVLLEGRNKRLLFWRILRRLEAARLLHFSDDVFKNVNLQHVVVIFVEEVDVLFFFGEAVNLLPVLVIVLVIVLDLALAFGALAVEHEV